MAKGVPLRYLMGPKKRLPFLKPRILNEIIDIPEYASDKSKRERNGKVIKLNPEHSIANIKEDDSYWPCVFIKDVGFVFPEQTYLFLKRLLYLTEEFDFDTTLKKMQTESSRGCYSWQSRKHLRLLKLMDVEDIKEMIRESIKKTIV